ncbi:uncharacterized protein LOC142182255 [Nicotiana tabacum]|uniref:Uncharacterized protein LOC142182255 n=1 Tax=Nicotiana tabacum TaxID=4097 RepID=A0AC58USQ5_TOBAC
MAGEYRGDKVGQRVILPASFIGGLRDMRRRYMDAMALVQRYKITSADQYDKFISAELPDEEEYPLLHDLVVKHMMHGPCGKHRPTNLCMTDGQCKNHYPRPFSNKLIQGKDGYPIYKRKNDGKIVNVRGMRMNNQWVVPYNPYLLTRYNCHINVESCSGVKAIKYLYKYIYKGHDRCTVYIESDDGKKVVDEKSKIFKTHVGCLRQKHYGEFMNSISVKCNIRSLTFNYISRIDKQGKIWTKRKTRSVIGRIATANRREGERYYLRLLLNHVRGPLSFKDLLTVNGRECETFKEAAKERGLLESDNSISECLREAVLFKMPSALRNLFATILVHCNPTDIRKLWETYYEDMPEDFRKIHDNSHVAQLQCTLKSINYFLESMGKKIDKYDFLKLDHGRDNGNVSECREIIEERSINVSPEDFDAQSKLNPEQEQAFKTILERVDSGRAGLFFVDGSGGTGKTFLYRALLANLRSRGMIALAMATSGVATTILPGGHTAHSRFDIPLQTTDTTITNMSKQSDGAKLIRKSKLIIWDEAPMANHQMIETVDRSFRDIMDINEPFGGKVMVFGGDFRQVLPIVPKSTRA